MKKQLVYQTIIETLKELEDNGWTNDKTGAEIRKEVLRKINEAVGFACNDLVQDGYITSSTEDFKLIRNKLDNFK